MPASHVWEIVLDGQTIEASKAEVLKLAKAAKEAGVSHEVLENGEPVTSKSVKQVDTFKSEVFIQLSRMGYSFTTLTREFDSGMSDSEVLNELDDMLVSLTSLYDKVNARVAASQDAQVYGPQEVTA